MAVPRPVECPECGHERLRPRGSASRSLAATELRPPEHWVCGLCQYEWSISTDRFPFPPSPSR
jgi:transposase-like protein